METRIFTDDAGNAWNRLIRTIYRRRGHRLQCDYFQMSMDYIGEDASREEASRRMLWLQVRISEPGIELAPQRRQIAQQIELEFELESEQLDQTKRRPKLDIKAVVVLLGEVPGETIADLLRTLRFRQQRGALGA